MPGATQQAQAARTRQDHDLQPNQRMVLTLPQGPGLASAQITITLVHKSGRAARLQVQAPLSVRITRDR